MAADNGRAEVVSLLLAAGAAVEAKDQVRESDHGASHGPLNALCVIHEPSKKDAGTMVVCVYVCPVRNIYFRSFTNARIDLTNICMHVLYA